jgi:hypothetical protein
MQVKLIVIGGRASKGEIVLTLPAWIGRHREATLTVGHPKVSRWHCELIEVKGDLVVRDTGSTNGTFVDGSRVQESIVKPGDRITIGPLTFVAVYEPGEGSALRAQAESRKTPAAGLAKLVQSRQEDQEPLVLEPKQKGEPKEKKEPRPALPPDAAEGLPAGGVPTRRAAAGPVKGPPAFSEEDLAWLSDLEDAPPPPKAVLPKPGGTEPPRPHPAPAGEPDSELQFSLDPGLQVGDDIRDTAELEDSDLKRLQAIRSGSASPAPAAADIGPLALGPEEPAEQPRSSQGNEAEPGQGAQLAKTSAEDEALLQFLKKQRP